MVNVNRKVAVATEEYVIAVDHRNAHVRVSFYGKNRESCRVWIVADAGAHNGSVPQNLFMRSAFNAGKSYPMLSSTLEARIVGEF